MSTFIDGVGQCQVIDKSGELVDLKGHDITSLAKTGVFNWEHLANTPATLVGKILKAKKIFSKDDCENDRELYYWNKCKVPYLYIMGELLDDYTASAKECAGQMKYSRDNPGQAPLLGFSIEGSEIPNTRKGMIITRSIARKCTLTVAPCNSMCIAEVFESPDQKPQIKDEFEEIFKTEANAIEMFKSDEGLKIYEEYLAKMEAEGPSIGGKPPKSPYSEYENQGTHIGTTKSGKKVYSHGHAGNYGFNPAEHKEAAEHHRRAAVKATNPKLADNHIQRMALHNNAAISGGRQENRAALSLNQKDKVAQEQGKQQVTKSDKLCEKHKKLKKDDPSPSPSPMSTPPPEPNQSNAAAMQAGATQSGWQPQQWMTNIKEGLGMDKSENHGWSEGKSTKTGIHYSHPEHGIVSIHKQPSGEFHVKHQGKLAGVGGVKGTFKSPHEAGSHAKKYMQAVSQKKILSPKMQNISSDKMLETSDKHLSKALEAGSYNAAPSTLTGGAVYQKECRMSNQSMPKKKRDWNKQAKDDYERWPSRAKFESFMKARMPHLALGEIKAIGRTLALKKTIDFEKSLENLISFKKSESVDS